jgi:hypothetical protein
MRRKSPVDACRDGLTDGQMSQRPCSCCPDRRGSWKYATNGGTWRSARTAQHQLPLGGSLPCLAASLQPPHVLPGDAVWQLRDPIRLFANGASRATMIAADADRDTEPAPMKQRAHSEQFLSSGPGADVPRRIGGVTGWSAYAMCAVGSRGTPAPRKPPPAKATPAKATPAKATPAKATPPKPRPRSRDRKP